MSWESTVPYYETINRTVQERLGGHHSAKILLYSVDFAEVEALQHEDDWSGARDLLADAAKRLERGGADFLVLATNTMHRVYDGLKERTRLPILHIADCAAEPIKDHGMKTVGLLGTLFTMEQAFYRERLESRHGIKAITPELEDREAVHRIIFEELVLGKLLDESRDRLHAVVERLREAGAEGVILGCTELPLLADPTRAAVELFDTGVLHARRAAQVAVGDADI
jgi:aspartate racemase